MILQGVTLKNSGFIVDMIYGTVVSAGGGSTGGGVTSTVDPYFRYTSLLVHADGINGANNAVVLDSGLNSVTPKVNGNVTQGTNSPYNQNGYSYYFDQSTTLLPQRVTLVPGVYIGANAYTVETWFWLDNTTFSTPYGLFGGTSNRLNIGIANANAPWLKELPKVHRDVILEQLIRRHDGWYNSTIRDNEKNLINNLPFFFSKYNPVITSWDGAFVNTLTLVALYFF